MAIDYMVRLPLAEQRSRFVRRHLPDLLVIVLPFLRPMQVVVPLLVLHQRADNVLSGRAALFRQPRHSRRVRQRRGGGAGR